MTYKELYEKATWLLEHSKISGKEYDNMIEPLNAEICVMPTVDAIPVEWIESQVDKGKWAELVQRWVERKSE